MKRIPLREIDDLSYAEVLREVVRRPLDRRAGIGITELRASLRVLDALDSANGTLELEDADYSHLCEKLQNMQWNVVDRRLVELIDHVLGAD